MRLLLERAEDLDAAAVLAVADGAGLELGEGLLARLEASRAATLAALTSAGPVYGVSTGMGSQAGLAVDSEEQPGFQGDLMLARSVGRAPWMDRRTVRAVLATRLRTLLGPETGVSPDLARALVDLLDADLHPALPVAGHGAAGEIIVMAHLGAFLTGRGQGLDRSGRLLESSDLLGAAGLTAYVFAAKEGVAFLEGTPAAAARAALVASDARVLGVQQTAVAAAEIALVRAPRDPYHPALARGDDELATALAALRDLAGDEDAPRMLQAPLSFRVVGPALAHLLRVVGHLEAAVDRSLAAVSTSPALVDGRFLGTAGFDGFDLGAAADACRLAVLHCAETAAARLHRLLDPRVTGLAPQLSAQPGRQAGLVVLHKHAVGLVHDARRMSAPAALGAMETSLGQEDVQSFALEAMAAAYDSLGVLRSVTACELVALHQARLLDPTAPNGTDRLQMVLHKAFGHLNDLANDRPLGREVTVLSEQLVVGWAHDVLDHARAAAVPRPPATT